MSRRRKLQAIETSEQIKKIDRIRESKVVNDLASFRKKLVQAKRQEQEVNLDEILDMMLELTNILIKEKG